MNQNINHQKRLLALIIARYNLRKISAMYFAKVQEILIIAIVLINFSVCPHWSMAISNPNHLITSCMKINQVILHLQGLIRMHHFPIYIKAPNKKDFNIPNNNNNSTRTFLPHIRVFHKECKIFPQSHNYY